VFKKGTFGNIILNGLKEGMKAYLESVKETDESSRIPKG
jgi:hypothetical protein